MTPKLREKYSRNSSRQVAKDERESNGEMQGFRRSQQPVLLILGGDPNAQLIICVFVFPRDQMFVAMGGTN